MVSVVYPVWFIDCHDNIISAEGFLGRLVYTPRFSWWWFVLYSVSFCSLYVPFRDFSCAFCPVIVCLVVLGAPFSSEMYFFFFLMSSSCQLFVLVVLFVCLQWHTVGAEIKVPYVENPELWNFPFKAWSRSKYSYACFSDCQEGFHSSVWYLSSQCIHHVFQNGFTWLFQKM